MSSSTNSLVVSIGYFQPGVKLADIDVALGSAGVRFKDATVIGGEQGIQATIRVHDRSQTNLVEYNLQKVRGAADVKILKEYANWETRDQESRRQSAVLNIHAIESPGVNGGIRDLNRFAQKLKKDVVQPLVAASNCVAKVSAVYHQESQNRLAQQADSYPSRVRIFAVKCASPEDADKLLSVMEKAVDGLLLSNIRLYVVQKAAPHGQRRRQSTRTPGTPSGPSGWSGHMQPTSSFPSTAILPHSVYLPQYQQQSGHLNPWAQPVGFSMHMPTGAAFQPDLSSTGLGGNLPDGGMPPQSDTYDMTQEPLGE
eukprot:TRINITY_DN33173_c0_g1_i1.p1 TRINITY_DN33173_c0_g1~~TRINITY_DN33173_c0_g1_i1.p1  ORF type:complete len:312 (+),score=27.15 TRINITY_DN33173_c0_g1_i1:37-972(+)